MFDAMDGKNAWTYSAMLSGLALHRDGRKALQVFDAMVREGHAPDGLLEDGLRCFDRMRLEHKVAPNGCMVDLMARVGRLDGRARSSGACPRGRRTRPGEAC